MFALVNDHKLAVAFCTCRQQCQ